MSRWALLTAVGNSTDRASARLPGTDTEANTGLSASSVWAWATSAVAASAVATAEPVRHARREEVGIGNLDQFWVVNVVW